MIKRTLFCCIFVYLFVPAISVSATQGTLGATSVGDVQIGLAISDAARISGLDDAIFGTYDGTGNVTNNDDVCVFSTTGSYEITATGDGAGGAFTITDGSNTIPYTVRWNDVAGTNSGGTNISSGQLLTGQTGADTSSPDCSGLTVLTARVRVRMTENNLLSAPDGTYVGVLTITIGVE